ncbi:nickel pincer cofactor biosynthesis protein LarC [Levilactobacillus suantsaii]|uniref:Pyridinium-3,5-bisthiocarboxylic acid mononucleotide nickel insertion protein n=1 Tax=Levilactobacillus suantsaii TaxID=2292255 RepID=A0A4Q0VMD2_9LACO|nr:nickel pincer cofactor biosynthesis protein LarC [Levilactobacillus suantsaii]QMU07973.1 nickel pincer cofactor biosynthesis protein LarC [Levilactobacillus suantsaii]RXI79850.1 nickel pincer cofactor biosynthesis protein LarC [Levilactobacillus suantsaii]
MRTLYLDAFSGVSGDMFIGALLDLGVKLSDLEVALKQLHVTGYTLQAERTAKSAIYGTNFDVVLDRGTKDHGFVEGPHNHHGRHLSDIVQLIQSSDLKATVKQHAIAIFQDIGQAESQVHQVPLTNVHFHEVGALDSIVDIVGSCICLDLLHVDQIKCSTIADGSGFINVAHGEMPVPVPAVAQMLTERPIPVQQHPEIHTELLTPTGLGLVKEFVTEFGPLNSQMAVQKVGYGFGKRETGRFNALRAMVVTTAQSQKETVATQDQVWVLETNLDDQTAEGIGFAQSQLLTAGALDVYVTPVQMKKARPGVLLTVLAAENDRERLVTAMLKYTTAKGIRYTQMARTVMKRHFTTVSYKGMPIRLKVATYHDIHRVTPEYEDCQTAAQKLDVALETVMAGVQAQLS